MSKQLAHAVASRLNMQPALFMPACLDMVTTGLHMLANAEASDDAERRERVMRQARQDMLSAYGYEVMAEEKEFAYADGIAFIPVTGMLINRCNWSYSCFTGYNFIRAQLNMALGDQDVKMIVLDCHSYGGEVVGCFELCEDIRAARDVKPILAVVDSASYSACYAVASSASRVTVTPSGGVGSVGVIAMHIDMSKFLTDMGVTVTLITAGEHKADGNSFEPLPKPVRDNIQIRVDNTRQKFATLVASNRGIDVQAVLDTEAACYTAEEAVDLGLIDAIAKPLDAVRAFLTELSGSPQPLMETTMSTPVTKPGAEGSATATQASAAQQIDPAAERAAERQRIASITTHEAAKGRESLASHLALKTDMSVAAAVAILGASPVESKAAAPAAGKSAFHAAMDSSDHPNVGADQSTQGAGNLSAAQRILASQAAATGIKH